jgi:hypothetical protein
MKDLLYRLPSSRSFAKLFSILAVAVVAFAALELLVVQQALAGVWCCQSSTAPTAKCVCDASLSCPSTFPRNTFKSCGVTGAMSNSGTINSSISCTDTGVSGGNFWDSTSVGQSAILDCTVTESADPSHNGQGFCQFDILYSRQAGLQTACTSTPDLQNPGFMRSHEAFCNQVGTGNSPQVLKVEGMLKCDRSLNDGDLPPFCENDDCILRTGIAGVGGQCSQLFEADAGLGLATGQVLRLTQTFEADDSSCVKPPTSVGPAIMRYCNGNHFNGDDVDCTFRSEEATIVGTAENVLPFDVDFSPEVLNVSCNNLDVWRFRIFGNDQLNPALINVDSLRVEGFEGVSCADAVTVKVKGKTTTYRDCEIQACPASGPQLGRFVAQESENRQFVLTVTGELEAVPPSVGNEIFGEQLVTTSGQ